MSAVLPYDACVMLHTDVIFMVLINGWLLIFLYKIASI